MFALFTVTSPVIVFANSAVGQCAGQSSSQDQASLVHVRSIEFLKLGVGTMVGTHTEEVAAVGNTL